MRLSTTPIATEAAVHSDAILFSRAASLPATRSPPTQFVPDLSGAPGSIRATLSGIATTMLARYQNHVSNQPRTERHRATAPSGDVSRIAPHNFPVA